MFQGWVQIWMEGFFPTSFRLRFFSKGTLIVSVFISRFCIETLKGANSPGWILKIKPLKGVSIWAPERLRQPKIISPL